MPSDYTTVLSAIGAVLAILILGGVSGVKIWRSFYSSTLTDMRTRIDELKTEIQEMRTRHAEDMANLRAEFSAKVDAQRERAEGAEKEAIMYRTRLEALESSGISAQIGERILETLKEMKNANTALLQQIQEVIRFGVQHAIIQENESTQRANDTAQRDNDRRQIENDRQAKR